MSKQQQTEEQSLPWYRYPIVWMAFMLPVIVVVASIITIVIAHKNPPVMYQAQPTEAQPAPVKN